MMDAVVLTVIDCSHQALLSPSTEIVEVGATLSSGCPLLPAWLTPKPSIITRIRSLSFLLHVGRTTTEHRPHLESQKITAYILFLRIEYF